MPAYDALRHAMKEAALRTRGALDRSTRESLMGGAPVEGPLGAYAAAVRDPAYRVTDAQVAALSAAGVSGEAIYEATVSAAIGAGLLRFEKARAAMEAADEGP